MKHQFLTRGVCAAICALSFAQFVRAAFITQTSPASWTRPADNATATATHTTFQEWDGFTSAAGPNTAAININPNGTPNAFDNASPADGAFLIGTDIYSFSTPLNPVITVAGFGISGNKLNVFVQVQSFGADIDTGDLSISYTDAGGVHTVAASSLANYSYTQLFISTIDVGFGLADQVDHAWTFIVPDTSTLQLSFGWGVSSSALQDISVDTQSTLPEPATFGVISTGGFLLVRRRRNRALQA